MNGNNKLKFVFGGQELNLSPRVKHKYVRRAQNLMTEWMLRNIDMTAIMGTESKNEASMNEMLHTAIMEKPDLAIEIQDIENSIILDQTIMLASGLDYVVLTELKEEAYEDEYIELYEKCSDLLGGNANDFFEVYLTGSTLKQRKTRTNRRTAEKKASESISQV